MTSYKVLKSEAKKLNEITRGNIARLRASLGLCSTTTFEDCNRIMQELHPLTKRQKEVFSTFENGWHYAGTNCTYHGILLTLVKKGYLRTNSQKTEFKRIIPIAE